MAATYPADTFQEGVDLTIEASNQIAQVVRGDANTEVMVAYRDWETDRKSTRLNSSHSGEARMPSSA